MRGGVLRSAAAGLAALGLAAAAALGIPGGACAPAAAAESAPAGVITIALLPERNVFEQKKRYQPLESYLAAAIGRPVVFKLLDDYQAIFAEILDHRVDGGFFGSMTGAIAQVQGNVEILARPVEFSGASTYAGLIFTKSGSGITRDPATWKNKRVALVNKATTAGYLYPLSLLRRAGYGGDPQRHFAHISFTGSHDSAILAVFNGEADLGACKNTVYEEYTRLHPEIGRRLEIIAVSPEVPSNGLGVHPRVDQETKRRLREALLTMIASEEGRQVLRRFQARRFVETTLKNYDPVFTMAREAGIDLAAWPLREIR